LTFSTKLKAAYGLTRRRLCCFVETRGAIDLVTGLPACRDEDFRPDRPEPTTQSNRETDNVEVPSSQRQALSPSAVPLLLRLLLLLCLEKQTAAFGCNSLSKTGTCCRVSGIDSKALALLALLAGFSLLFVHDLHIMIEYEVIGYYINMVSEVVRTGANIRQQPEKRILFCCR